MQEKAKGILDYFVLLEKYGRLATSYLFLGAGFDTTLDIVKLITCTQSEYFCDVCDDCVKIDKGVHPDVFILKPPGATIGIDQIRAGRRFLFTKSFQAKRKALLVYSAHLMSLDAANAFLKTLEEPPGHSFIALLSWRSDLLLPTIVSRCRKIYLPPGEAVSATAPEEVMSLLEGSEIAVRDRKHFAAVLLRLITVVRDYLVYSIYQDTKKLIHEDNYEIICRLRYPFKVASRILEKLLNVYNAHDTVNINLALNLIRLSLR